MLNTITTSRRGFMQLSATSAAALTLGASVAGLTGCSKVPTANGYKVLRPGDIEILRAVAPVILSGSYPGSLAADGEADRKSGSAGMPRPISERHAAGRY